MNIKPFILSIFLISIVYGQDNDLNFEHFGTKDGITNNYITSITQDPKGYIWFTTQYGLNKFDGYNFKSYTYDPKNQNTPSGNWMNFLIADKHGKIWIFQGIGGIDCFDTDLEKFENFTNEENNDGSISEKYILTAHLDIWDNLWLGMKNTGINKFNRYDKSFIKYSHDAKNDFFTSSNQVVGLRIDTLNSNKYLWISTGGIGFNRLNIETNEIQRYKWRNFYPDKKLIDFIKSANNERIEISSITKVGDNQKLSKNFKLNEKTRVLIVCQGEGYLSGNIDFGSIRKNNFILWKSDPQKSFFAGGEQRNRIQFDIIELEEGNYNLYFESDSLHSYKNWYKSPPKIEEFWGIKIFKLNENISKDLNLLIRNSEKKTSLNNNIVNNIVRIKDNLWISTWGGGLNRMNLYSEEFKNYFSSSNQSCNYLKSIKSDYLERIWIVDKDNHLLCFDTKTEKYINFYSHNEDLKNVIITGIIEDSKGNIWIGTQKRGLYKISLDSVNSIIVKNYRNDSLNPKSISGNSISYLFEDLTGNIWVGTNGYGLNKFNEEKNKFNLVTDKLNFPLSLSNRFVNSFAEDEEGNIWIATQKGGLNKFDKSKNIIITGFEGLKGNSFKNISTLFYDKKNVLYLGLASGGVYKLNIKNNVLKKLITIKYSNFINGFLVSSIIRDSEGYLWVGTRNAGAFRINEFTGHTERFINIPKDSSSILSNDVWTIYMDNSYDVWIGTATGGISKLIKGKSEFINYTSKGNDPYRFPNQTVECFYEDSEGNFWVGSFSAGLNLLNRKTNEFKYYTVNDGLPGNRIDGIVEDETGNLWLSTNNGISKFNYSDNTFKNYDYSYGLQDNEFTKGAYLKTSSGEIYFGGGHGFNYFNPSKIVDNKIIPKINLTVLKKNNTEIKLDKTGDNLEIIKLNYDEGEISFEFVSLDYTAPEKNMYAYKMEGFDSNWVYCGKRRYANYTNLNSGTYVFKVIGSNSDGVWNEEGAFINIIVYPPFWESWWFYFVNILFVISLVYSLNKIIVNRKMKQLIEHQRIRNLERERVREELSRDFHDELGHKLTRISMYARNLKKKSKINLSEVMHDLNKVNETSNSLYLGAKDLIWALNPGEDTLYDAAIRLKDFGDDLFDKTGINFSAKGINEGYKSIKLPMEWKRHLLLIFKESMNNIIKYAECKNVSFNIEYSHPSLKIILSDDGKGFEVNNESGGYGLRNIKKRAEKLNGHISIKSDNENGTIIIFESNIPHL